MKLEYWLPCGIFPSGVKQRVLAFHSLLGERCRCSEDSFLRTNHLSNFILAKNIGSLLEKLSWDTMADSAHLNLCCCWAGWMQKPNTPSCPLSYWHLSLGSCAGRWSGPWSSRKLTKEGSKEGAGKGEGKEGMDVHFCNPCFHKLASPSPTICHLRCVIWTEVDRVTQSLFISVILCIHVFSYFFPLKDAQSKYYHSCCPSLDIPFSSSAMFLLKLSDSVAHSVLGERVTVIYIRTL